MVASHGARFLKKALGAMGPALGLSLLLAACAPSPAEAPAAPPAPAAQPTAPQPKRGGVFHLAARQPAPHLNYYAEAGVASNITLNPIYERLLNYDYKPQQDWRKGFTVVPLLAERWEQPDPKTYVFRIRQGIKWHDGTEFTAQDVAWAYNYLRDPANAYRGSGNLADAATIEATDRYTLKITTKQPAAVFLELLADRQVPILPRQVVERGDKLEQVAIGTGPFKLVSYDRQKGMEYVRNEDYWNKGRPYVDRVKIFFGLDPSGMQAAFQAKQNDVLKLNDKPQFDAVKRLVPALEVEPFLRDIVNSVYTKLDRPPFNDKRVRQALHLAIDRKGMIDALTFGEGIPNPPGMNGGREGWVIPQEELKNLPGWRQPKDRDLEEAKKLLAEAGYGGGLRFTAKFTATHTTTPKEAEVIASQLRKIGVEMQLLPMELGVFQKAYDEGDYEAAVESFVQFQPEKDWNSRVHSKGRLNKQPVNDPELDRLIEAQAAELDVKKRQQLFIQIQRRMLEEMYVIPTIGHVSYTVRQPYAHGWIDNYAGQAANLDWSQLWLDVEQLPADRRSSAPPGY